MSKILTGLGSLFLWLLFQSAIAAPIAEPGVSAVNLPGSSESTWRKKGDAEEACKQECKDWEESCKEIGKDAKAQCKVYDQEEKACVAQCGKDKDCEKACKFTFKEWKKVCEDDAKDWEKACDVVGKDCENSCKYQMTYILFIDSGMLLLPEITATQLSSLSLEVLLNLTPAQFSALPPQAVSGFTTEQIVQLPSTTVEGFTCEQLAMLSPELKASFSEAQQKALPNCDGKPAKDDDEDENEGKEDDDDEGDDENEGKEDDDDEGDDENEGKEDDDEGDDEGDDENEGKEDDDEGDENGNQSHKVTICHKGNTISIAKPALPAHLAQGATEGPCKTDENPPVIDEPGTPSTSDDGDDTIDEPGTPTTEEDDKPIVIIDIPSLDAEAMAQLSIDFFAQLTAADVSLFPIEALSGLTIEQLAALKPEAMAGFSAEQLAALAPELMAALQAEHIRFIKPEAIAGLSMEHISYVVAKATAGFEPPHIAYLSEEAVSGFTLEHFEYISLAAIQALTPENLGGLSEDIIEVMGLDILLSMEEEEVKKVPEASLAWFFLNIEIKPTAVAQVERFIPKGWIIQPDVGKVKIPKGKLKLPTVKLPKLKLPKTVKMPELPDFHVSLNLGQTAQQTTVIEQINQTFDVMQFSQYRCQQENGIVKIQGTGDSRFGANFSFIPQEDSFATVEDDTPPGIEYDAQGNVILITTAGLKTKLLPAPRDVIELEKVTKGGKVEVDKRGHTRLEVPYLGKTLHGVFDPQVSPAPEDKEVGISIEGEPGNEVAYVVYEDGMMQKMYPTIIDVERFITARKYLEDAHLYGRYQIDSRGHIYMAYGDLLGQIVPTFDVNVNVNVNVSRSEINIIEDGTWAELITDTGEKQTFRYEIIGNASDYDFGDSDEETEDDDEDDEDDDD